MTASFCIGWYNVLRLHGQHDEQAEVEEERVVDEANDEEGVRNGVAYTDCRACCVCSLRGVCCSG